MRVAQLWTPAGELTLAANEAPSGDFARLMEAAGLASAVRPMDPMDRAIRRLLPKAEAGEPVRVSAPLGRTHGDYPGLG